MLNQNASITTKLAIRMASWGAKGAPVLMNCGNSAAAKMINFGLENPVPSPAPNIATSEGGAGLSASALPATGARHALIPSQTR